MAISSRRTYRDHAEVAPISDQRPAATASHEAMDDGRQRVDDGGRAILRRLPVGASGSRGLRNRPTAPRLLWRAVLSVIPHRPESALSGGAPDNAAGGPRHPGDP